MARAKQSTEEVKPAATQPAEKQPAVKEGVGIPEMAKILGRTEKSTRAAIRRALGGAQVGRGGRYVWDSVEDPAFVSLVEKLTPKKTEDNEIKA